MDLAKSERIKKFFTIAFIVKNKGCNFGVTRSFVEGLIRDEFNVVSDSVVDRFYLELIKSKFIITGINGVKANPRLEQEFKKFFRTSVEIPKGGK